MIQLEKDEPVKVRDQRERRHTITVCSMYCTSTIIIKKNIILRKSREDADQKSVAVVHLIYSGPLAPCRLLLLLTSGQVTLIAMHVVANGSWPKSFQKRCDGEMILFSFCRLSHIPGLIISCCCWSRITLLILYIKQALERYRKDGSTLKCKRCVQEMEEAERKVAAAKQASTAGGGAVSTESRNCAICQKGLTYGAYNKNQWNKGEGKSKCRSCVEQALAQEASQQKASSDEKLEIARQKVKEATASGNQPAILKAESELAALEAEQVTGLKPVRMGRGGGRGRSRGSGRTGGRGRGCGGRK